MKLAGLIDWSRFDEAYGRFYHQKGRPGSPTRLMAGLHLLKHLEGLSDEAVCARWVENPYPPAFVRRAVLPAQAGAGSFLD